MNKTNQNKSNIYLMGFMGCGKTKIGSLLANRIDFPFIDTDKRVAEESGMSIVEIFEKEGETSFRSKEKELIEHISKLTGHVVSLGGGTVVNPENWEKISGSGITITLSYPPEIIASRLEKKSDRPLLNRYSGPEKIQHISALMEKRNPYYNKADMVLHLNREAEPNRVVETLLGYLKGQK
jgi:shikimate kinase